MAGKKFVNLHESYMRRYERGGFLVGDVFKFNDLREKYSSKNFEILGISVNDTKEQLQNFLNAYKIDYPILYGTQSELQKVSLEYGGIYSIPISILIGPNNEIVRVYPGAILKQYDPNMYADLIYNIELSLSKIDGK